MIHGGLTGMAYLPGAKGEMQRGGVPSDWQVPLLPTPLVSGACSRAQQPAGCAQGLFFLPGFY